MSMSNTEANISPDISVLNLQSPRPEEAQESDNNNDSPCKKDSQNSLNYYAEAAYGQSTILTIRI